MSDFKNYFTNDCIAFTTVVLIYSFMAELGVFTQPDSLTVFVIFGMTSLTEVLMFITDHFEYKSRLLGISVHLVDSLITVFSIGALFHFFSLSWKTVLIVALICIVTYFCVYGIAMIKTKADADAINQKIKDMQNHIQKGGKES